MKKNNKIRLGFASHIAVLFLLPAAPATAADGIAPAADDETLIYVIRPKRFTGGAVGFWIAVNDQTVARVKHKKHAVVRAKAGRISLNLAIQGSPVATIAVDDRPGETVYLKYRLGDENIVEVDEEAAHKLMRKSKLMDPIGEALPNNEEIRALLNLSRFGFELMRPASSRLEPDSEAAVITLFRRNEVPKLEFGICGEDGFVATLKANEGVDLRVPAGDHFFLAGQTGTTVMKASVEAGKRYYAWLDVGKMILRVRLTPVARDQANDLDAWLTDVEWVELNPEAMTTRINEREGLVVGFVQSVVEKANQGAADFTVLAADHSQ